MNTVGVEITPAALPCPVSVTTAPRTVVVGLARLERGVVEAEEVGHREEALPRVYAPPFSVAPWFENSVR